VPDRETAQLMRDFFAELGRQQGDAAEALRRAQLARLRVRRAQEGAAHPFYWAAFALTATGR
jgi:CHAT domain-containing protein